MEIPNTRCSQCAVTAPELWGLHTRTRQRPLGAKDGPQLTASKEMETPVLTCRNSTRINYIVLSQFIMPAIENPYKESPDYKEVRTKSSG